MLGEEIAVPAHHEGRRAFRDGMHGGDNPYDKHAKYDTDEYLRYRNWGNGWNFAWWKENTMRCPKCNVNVTRVDDVWHCPMCKRNWNIAGVPHTVGYENQGELLPRKE